MLSCPKLIVNFWVKDRVWKELGFLKGRVSKSEDFAKFHETAHFEFGYDFEEGWKAYSFKSLPAALKELSQLLDTIAAKFHSVRSQVLPLVSVSLNQQTPADVKALTAAGLAYDEKDYCFKFVR